MPFVLKRIDEDEENYTPPRVFYGKIKIGSAPNSDLVVDSMGVLPFHCELYPWGKEHRLVGSHSAIVIRNEKEIEDWPVSLQDGDVLTIGKIQYKFHILHEAMKRSWKASFSSHMAIFLLALLILFEMVIIVWLPYNLKHQKGRTLATLKQEIYMTIDNLRGTTRALAISNKDTDGLFIKSLLNSCEDELATYLRKYGDNMNWEDSRMVFRDLNILQNIVDSWPTMQKAYTRKLKISPKIFINNLTNSTQLDTQTGEGNEVSP